MIIPNSKTTKQKGTKLKKDDNLPGFGSPECKKYVERGLDCYKPQTNRERTSLIYGLQNAFWAQQDEYRTMTRH
jgi:hypothetical protein